MRCTSWIKHKQVPGGIRCGSPRRRRATRISFLLPRTSRGKSRPPMSVRDPRWPRVSPCGAAPSASGRVLRLSRVTRVRGRCERDTRLTSAPTARVVSGRRCRTETWHMLRSSRLRSGEVTSGPARCGQPASQTGNCAAEAPTCDAHLVLAPADAAWKNAPSHECLATRAGLVCRRPAQRGRLPPGAFYVCRVSRVSEVAANETRAPRRRQPREW
jgi:hypothetical protein